MTSPSDKYRPQFCQSDYYISHQKDFQIIQKEIQHLPPKEQFVIWVISCCCLRKPSNWYGGTQAIESHFKSQPDSSIKNGFDLPSLFQQINLYWPKKINPEINLFDFCNTVRIKPLPKSIHRSLFYFLTDKYPLEILCYEPHPQELLAIQTQGRRIITFEKDFSIWAKTKYGERDPLSFWLHDLIHADHFFRDSKNRNSQIGFYFLIQAVLKNNLLEELLLSAEFKDGFHYLISDMNAHSIHLLKTLKALIDIHHKPLASKIITQGVWKRIAEIPFILSQPEVHRSFLKVNAFDFTETDAVILTRFFELDLYRLTLP